MPSCASFCMTAVVSTMRESVQAILLPITPSYTSRPCLLTRIADHMNCEGHFFWLASMKAARPAFLALAALAISSSQVLGTTRPSCLYRSGRYQTTEAHISVATKCLCPAISARLTPAGTSDLSQPYLA